MEELNILLFWVKLKGVFLFRTEFWNFRSSQTRKELSSRIIVNRESNISQIKSDLSQKQDQKYREVIFRIYTLYLKKSYIQSRLQQGNTGFNDFIISKHRFL